MSKYIIYKAKQGQTEGAITRKLTHCDRLTDILYTSLSYSAKSAPKKGDRPLDSVTISEALKPHQRDDGTTHSCKSNWVVDSVETFNIDGVGTEFDSIVICWCVYEPVTSPVLTPVITDKRFAAVSKTEKALATV